MASCRPIISPFASRSVARQGEPIGSRDVPGGAGRAMVLGWGQPWRRTDRRRQGRIYTDPDKPSAALSASKLQVDFLRQASCNRQKIAALCLISRVARSNLGCRQSERRSQTSHFIGSMPKRNRMGSRHRVLPTVRSYHRAEDRVVRNEEIATSLASGQRRRGPAATA